MVFERRSSCEAFERRESLSLVFHSCEGVNNAFLALVMRLFSCVVLAGFFCIGSAALAQIDYTRGGPVTAKNFDGRYVLNSAAKDNLQWVPDPAGSGRSVLFARVSDSDGNSAGAKRTEISPKYEYIKEGVRWYGFSFYLPDDWRFHAYDTVVAQLHSSQKTAVVPPPLVFALLDNNLVLGLHRQIDLSLPVSRINTATVNTVIATVVTGKWYCLVVRADWSSMPGKGSLNIWLNGNNVFKEQGQNNSYETWLGNYPKAGLYMPGLTGVIKREIYFDFIHLGGALSNFQEVNALTPCGAR